MCHFDELEKKLKSIPGFLGSKGKKIIDLRNPLKETITVKNFKKMYKKLRHNEEKEIKALESDKTMVG